MFLVVTCLAMLGVIQIVSWVTFMFRTFSRSCFEGSKKETDYEPPNVDSGCEDAKVRLTHRRMKKHGEASAKKPDDKEGSKDLDDSHGQPSKKIWVAASVAAKTTHGHVKYHLRQSCQGLNNADTVLALELCLFCEKKHAK